MAVSSLALLLLLSLASVYSNPLKYADTQGIKYSPVNLTEVTGEWNVMALASNHTNAFYMDTQYLEGMINITVQKNRMAISLPFRFFVYIQDEVEVSKNHDGVTFTGTAQDTVKRISEDCITVNLPAFERMFLTCRSHRVPKSVIKDFACLVACQNDTFMNASVNPRDDDVFHCGTVFQRDPLEDISKISGRWRPVARASKEPRSKATKVDHVDGWIEFTVHSGENVTVTTSPKTTDLGEIEDDTYIVKNKELSLKIVKEIFSSIVVYQTPPDQLLLYTFKYGEEIFDNNLFLLTRSGTVQDTEKEMFKTRALCKNFPHIYGIPADQPTDHKNS
ncbi:uncharacterized protein LOC115466234 isoform X2 [Microcaecilia unicolor]|uniref:Uncharacterized protein LOC115466234 isoform X2 n=1 Tax=Microcaecilia unicolor TaxID=1415580 RepID=A0A6P7XS08_9AMPH|nr:uncharacterized protein LOC115466234 isoform X2 [Microcaecilia unicolor]